MARLPQSHSTPFLKRNDYRRASFSAAITVPTVNSSVSVATALIDGSSAVRILLQTAGITLGTGLATLANMLDPQAIILGGGVGRASATYRKGLRAGLAFAVWPKGRNLPYVFSAALGADAGLVGAGLLGSGLVAQTGSNFP